MTHGRLGAIRKSLPKTIRIQTNKAGIRHGEGRAHMVDGEWDRKRPKNIGNGEDAATHGIACAAIRRFMMSPQRGK